MALPRISIVTPSLNQVSFIEENIKSVLDQKYSNFEHIVVDGGSTDGTLDVLRKHAHLHVISEPDRGQADALNKGFKIAAGEIIGWLNADDCYCAGIFHTVAEKFEDPEVMVVYGDGQEIDSQGNIRRTILARGVTAEALIKYWKWKTVYVQPAVFFRRTVFEDAGYLDEGLHYAMDHDFFIRLSSQYTLYYIPKTLARVRLHSTSKTGRVMQKIIPEYIRETHRVSRRYWGKPAEWSYFENLFSFLGAIGLSVLKNLFFVKGSKSRGAVTRLFRSGLPRSGPFGRSPSQQVK